MFHSNAVSGSATHWPLKGHTRLPEQGCANIHVKPPLGGNTGLQCAPPTNLLSFFSPPSSFPPSLSLFAIYDIFTQDFHACNRQLQPILSQSRKMKEWLEGHLSASQSPAQYKLTKHRPSITKSRLFRAIFFERSPSDSSQQFVSCQ